MQTITTIGFARPFMLSPVDLLVLPRRSQSGKQGDGGHSQAENDSRYPRYPTRPSAFIHTGLTRARGSMFTHFPPADLVAILNIPRLQTLPNSFKILREYRLSVVALVFSR